MALVEYSDSEGSEAEQSVAQQKPAVKSANTNFSVDRSNPQKIRVKLSDAAPSNGTHSEEPAPKRARLGGGFSGFNAMLPPPKRTAEQAQASKAPARKVFSLKTGPEPGFSREADTELKELFASHDIEESSDAHQEVGIPEVPKRTAEQTTKGNAFMFKPLSVARNPNKKMKKASSTTSKEPVPATATGSPAPAQNNSSDAPRSDVAAEPPPKKKISLFSTHTDTDIAPSAPEHDAASPPLETSDLENDGVTASYANTSQHATSTTSTTSTTDPATARTQSLSTIATDLNLSAAERRQLFGRSGNPSGNASASNIINFNTDQEYAHNEVLRANGETVQHNPVRAIAPGKHSLRQLVTAAQGQKDALEESFATGKRNRREAGSKYGW